ncbi:DoxX-like protein [Nocardia tenerifensis]|uniref:DoxX-like protein n=1 Tax=Nocardia tenerifensis TaxID=228006 RepID=A0A318JYR1_9NOCA|nr:DoxX family protein [Nocardia tenerifensis]PXX62186.1 DoxX-like protein [Nocardia tenerifensis]
MSKARSIGYWATTAAVVFVLATGGVADLIQRDDTAGGMIELGYPTYVMTILGFWKVLGAMAIAVPHFPLVKEWAYAGAFFDLTGGLASHFAHGSSVNHLIYTGFFAMCVVASWALRPADRKLGARVFRDYGRTPETTKTSAPPRLASAA